MALATLPALCKYLRLIENASELKRKMPASPNPSTMKEGMQDLSRLLGIDPAEFKDPRNIAALVGASRFVMIWGEPSVTYHVALVFDSSRVLLTVLIDPTHFEGVPAGQMGSASGASRPQGAAKPSQSGVWAQAKNEPFPTPAPPNPEPETLPDSLKPLLSGNTTLTCRLFRALFEHMLGFVSPAGAQQGNVLLVSQLTGSREHGRSFLSTAIFILGAEVDRDNLMSFMMQQGLFGMPIFEHMLQNRDYCDAFHSFRRVERAFIESPATEEARLRSRLDQFNAQFGGKPCGAKIFEADQLDKATIDAYQAASDVLEALALTPWCMSLNTAVSLDSSNCIRSVATIARHFERYGNGQQTKDQANKEIADHLLAFARQFSADTKPA